MYTMNSPRFKPNLLSFPRPVPTGNPTPLASPSSKHRVPLGAIIGACVGGLLFVIILSVVIILMRTRRRRKAAFNAYANEDNSSSALTGDRSSASYPHSFDPFPPPFPAVG